MSFLELTGKALTTVLYMLADTNFTVLLPLATQADRCAERAIASGSLFPTGVRVSPLPQLPFPGCVIRSHLHSHTHTAHTHDVTQTHTCSYTHNTCSHMLTYMLTLIHLTTTRVHI